jgi:hypothetical protein
MRTRSVVDILESDRDERPCYRIDFWEQPAPGYAWNSDVWIVEEAEDVMAVIDWAEAHSEGRRFQLLVRDRFATDNSYLLLAGDNPNSPA